MDYFAGQETIVSTNPSQSLGPRVPAAIEAAATGHDPRTCTECNCEAPCEGVDCAVHEMTEAETIAEAGMRG
jgi:hypothetical protein